MRAAVKSSAVYPVSNQEALARLESEPTIADVARDTQRFGRIGLPGRLAAILYYAFSKIDADDAEAFFDRLASGEGLVRGNPIFVLRAALLGSKTAKGSANPVWLSALTIKAWNKFRAGDDAVGLLKFTQGGAYPEAFPEPK